MKISRISTLLGLSLIASLGTSQANEPNPHSTKAQIPKGCAISNAFGWVANVNAMPPTAPRLGVTGQVVLPTAGYKVELVRKATDFNTQYVTLELVVTAPAQGTKVAQVVTTLEAKATVPDVARNLQKVIINCGGNRLAEITDITVLD